MAVVRPLVFSTVFSVPIHLETHSPSATHVEKADIGIHLPNDSSRSPANQTDRHFLLIFYFFSPFLYCDTNHYNGCLFSQA